MSKITMIGAYNYDNTLFDDLVLPTGIDADIFINEALIRCNEFELLYSDIDFLKAAITQWGNKHYRTFEKWIDALNIDFEPLYNYDRYEEYTDESQGNSISHTNTSSSSSNDRNVSAYDATTMQPKENEASSSNGSGSGLSSNDSTFKHTAHLYGNIGVTTSTQMLEDYLRVEGWNIYEHMADLFVDEFCIRIY